MKPEKKKKEKMERKYLFYIILFGLFEASWAVIWGAYNNYFPITLQAGGAGFNQMGVSTAVGFGIGAFATGIIMTLDNFFGMVFAPVFGAMSDQAKSRKKIVVFAGIISAVLVMALPFTYSSITPEKSGNTAALMGTLLLTVFVAFFMILFWSIGQSVNGGLTYSLIPSKYYNRVSSLIMFISGLGFIVSMFITSMLYKIHYAMPYIFGGAMLLLTMLAYVFLLKEPDGLTYADEAVESEGGGAMNPISAIKLGFSRFNKEQKIGVLKVYAVKVCGIFGIMGLQTYASSWGVNSLGVNEGFVPILLIFYFLGYLGAAIPAGALADRFTRKFVASIGLWIMIGGGALLYFVKVLPVVMGILIIIGMGNAILDVIPLTMSTEYAPNKKSMGILISTVQALGKISTVVSVPLLGFIIQVTNNNYGAIFISMTIASIIGMFILRTIEPYTKPIEEE